MTITVGVLTVSDRVSAGEMEDTGGPSVERALDTAECTVVVRGVVPDERAAIGEALRDWSDRVSVDVVFTTGGTGLGPRDVTPEATADVCERTIPGIAEAMRSAGLRNTVSAMLSRATAGIRGQTVIINLPGSPRGAAEGVETVLPILGHAVATIHGARH